MAPQSPYRLQIFLPQEMKAILRDIAHEERTSMQGLITRWLIEKASVYDEHKTVVARVFGEKA